ncbi:hypothetical protein Aduo_007900 [Ancylostoma duodenale]
MHSLFILASCLVFIMRCHAHYRIAVIDEYPHIGIATLSEPYPYVAVAPEPIVVAPSPLPVEVVEEGPVMAPSPVVVSDHLVAPASMVGPAPVLAYPVYTRHYHPRTEVRNIVRTYTKETGHVSDTVRKEFPTLLGAAFQEKLFDAKKAAQASSKSKSQS